MRNMVLLITCFENAAFNLLSTVGSVLMIAQMCQQQLIVLSGSIRSWWCIITVNIPEPNYS